VAIEGLFEASMTVNPFGAVEIDLPKVRTFVGVMTFKSHARRLINETRAIPIPARNCVAH
jgi:hypothetical protein